MLTAGFTENISLVLSEANLTSVNIGSARSGANVPFNTGASATTTLAGEAISEQPGLTVRDVALELPGVTLAHPAELSLAHTPQAGFGYRLAATLQRAFLDQFPASFFFAPRSLVDAKQLDGSTSIPYTHAYGELNFRHRSGLAASLAADYTGTNNWTNGPRRGYRAQFSIENLFDHNTGTQYANGLSNRVLRGELRRPGRRSFAHVRSFAHHTFRNPAPNVSLPTRGAHRSMRFAARRPTRTNVLLAMLLALVFLLAPHSARADDAIDPSLIPDGTYPARVDRIVDSRHIEVTMQGTLKVFLASARASLTFTERVKANDDIAITLADGKVTAFTKK